ncbi:MAG TPA: class I SAM-dependent methyltransferase [Sphingomicrobium sp.]|nr:class I SAM-dependent methyltransferase [Sphingomicrobium sp.]
MKSKISLLKDINREVPPRIDWQAGAQRYVKSFFDKYGRAATERLALSKPFLPLAPGDDFALAECTGYAYNFVNLVQRLKPSAGTTVLDVACGGGWFAHYMAKLGCKTLGIDISEDFIDLARRRFREDRYLDLPAANIDSLFAVHDIEAEPLPAKYHGTFDLIVLESCLHHFVDPVAALTHLAAALRDDGLIVVVEGENRKGPIKDEYMSVMREYDTLERPYSRQQIEGVFDLVGLPEREFMGQLNGWFSLEEEIVQKATQWIEMTEDSMNMAICAKTAAPLKRIFPDRGSDEALHFGQGWYESGPNGRWCGPSGQVKARKPVRNLRLTVSGHGKPQTVTIYGAFGELARVEFSAENQRETVSLGHLARGDILTLCSDTAFKPSWDGSADGRLLSFYIEEQK